MNKILSYAGVEVVVNITNPEDHIQKFWMRGDFYETKRNGLLPYLYDKYKGKKNIAVIDCGAHMGNHTLFFTKVMKANCIAIEALPHHMSLLRKNLFLSRMTEGGDYKTIQAALGAIHKKVNFKIEDPNNTGGACLDDTIDGEIEMHALDFLLSEDNFLKLDFIKVDIEGGNLGFLEGAKKTLHKFQPDIYIECATRAEYENTRMKLDDMLYKPTGKVFNATPTYEFVYHG